jgi:heat shock protein HslJ
MRRWGLAVLLALVALAAAFLLARGDSPQGDLTGRTWHLRAVTQDGTENVVPPDLDPTLRFRENGNVQADYGCNQGGGRYRIDGSEVVLRPMSHSFMGCVSDLEDLVIPTLRERMQWEVAGSRLTLSRGGVLLTFSDRNRR